MYTVYTSSYNMLLCMIFVLGMVSQIHMEVIHLCEPVLLEYNVPCSVIHQKYVQLSSVGLTPKYACPEI